MPNRLALRTWTPRDGGRWSRSQSPRTNSQIPFNGQSSTISEIVDFLESRELKLGSSLEVGACHSALCKAAGSYAPIVCAIFQPSAEMSEESRKSCPSRLTLVNS